MLSIKNEVDSTGFFKDLHVRFRTSFTDTDLKNFTNLSTDEERFTFVLNKNRSDDSLFKINLEEDKDGSKAFEYKEQGNKAFQDGSYYKAIYYYNKSLQFFPSNSDNSKDIAVTRANRSAALYHTEKFREALNDIEESINSGYPKDLLYKVKDRKARCLLALKQHKTALKAFQETITALDDAKLKTDNKQRWQRDVQIMISMMSKSVLRDEKIVQVSEAEKLNYKGNYVYKAACDAVAIKKGDLVGRYAEANRDIEIGEILLVEQPHCAVLLQEYTSSNCFQCFKRVEVGEPCESCSHVIFCSKKCKKEAWETHHKVECKILNTLWASGLSITCLMALRIITQNTPEFFLSQQLEESDSLWEKKVYKSSDYNTLFNLVRHETSRKVEDILHRANIAVFLLQCLKAGKYFTKEIDKEENLIGGLLLRHLQILQFNAHEVSELRVQGKNFANSVSTFIGGAVFPTLALFNHSCNPSITRYFNGTTVVTRAIKNMKKGDNISENYGPMFTQTIKEERQVTLRNQYWFSCECEACKGNWPIMDKMDITTLPFRCTNPGCENVIKVPLTTTNCVIICTKCSKSNNIIKGLKVLQDTETIFRLGIAYLEEGDSEGALKKFLELYKLVDEVLVPPFKDYHLCQQAIRTCFLTRGNTYKTNVKL